MSNRQHPNRKLGDGSMDKPFRPAPPNFELHGPLEVCGGLEMLASSADVPGVGHCPAIVFQFVSYDGTRYPNRILVLDANDMAGAVAAGLVVLLMRGRR